ncbi:MAG TPA: Crp/Fnr family transcriptional regulator [Rhizomicrobium sp.]|nr:Crp/Fnr family transcriptional regulator [Rhizomicrobium sp.]
MERNHLLAGLSPDDLALLAPHLEPIDMPFRFQVEIPQKPITYVYFPQDGIVSVVATGPREHSIEVGILGRDTITSHAALLGADRSANAVFVQLAGRGLRMKTELVRAAASRSPTLQRALLTAVHAFSIQASQTALANGRGTLEQRLARWLLMAHDRMENHRLRLTHELLSIMLGVQRPTVSLALQKMEVAGAIKTQRSVITIRNRSVLKKTAKGFYGVPEAEQERLTGWRSLHDRSG